MTYKRISDMTPKEFERCCLDILSSYDEEEHLNAFEKTHKKINNATNEDDPFLYAEKHMPTYVGLDCTVNSSEPHKVFPTRAMIRELLLEENKRISEALGIERSIDL